MYSYTMNIPLPPGFSHWRSRLSQSGQSGAYRLSEGRLGRLLRLSGVLRYVEIEEVEGCAKAQVTILDGSPADEAEASRALSHVFALDTDLNAFYQHCLSNEPGMLTVINAMPGARMIREVDAFISVIDSMISQQLNLAFAAELKRRLWALCGEEVLAYGTTMYGDPTPEAIAKLDYQRLRDLQYSGRKAEYIIDFARQVAAGEYDIAALERMDDEEAIASLCSLRGVGRWTAECVLLFGLGRQDLLPAGDLGLLRSASRMWGLSERISESELRAKSAAWSPWSSWYTYYLWLYDGLVAAAERRREK